MNMKNILRLMGALALTTGTATSVIACGQESPGVAMNGEVAKQLGLADADGKGMQVASFDLTTKADDVTWTIDALKTPIKASRLLADDVKKAASQACFDFITNVLKVKPTTGSKFEDGEFDKDVLNAITGEVTNIQPTLTKKDDKTDYAVTAGTFSFQFKGADNKYFGDKYGINLKVNPAAGVVSTGLTALVAKILVADTDAATNAKIMFAVGNDVPAGIKDGGVALAINQSAAAGKQFAAFNKLTALTITAQAKGTAVGEKWVADDTLTITYKTADVTFADTVKTELKLA